MRLPLPPCHTQTLPTHLRLPRLPLIPRRIVTTSTTSRAPIDIPKLVVPPGSPHHNTLPSFLAYADRRNMDKRSTVYVGTHYEYVVSQSLLRLGFSLFRTGGRADRGIDLLGHWVLPTLREPLPVVVQCKSMEGRCNPVHIRELEGSFQGTPAGWRNKDVLGLLVTTQNATKGVLERLGLSKLPLGFVKVSRRGTIEQCLWNEAAQARGLEGVGVTVRYTPLVLLNGKDDLLDEEEEDLPEIINGKRRRRKRVPEKFRIAGAKKDIQLTWMGSPIFPEREGLDEETIKLLDVLTHDSRELTRRLSRSGVMGRPRGSKNKPKAVAGTAKGKVTKNSPAVAGKKARVSKTTTETAKSATKKTSQTAAPPVTTKRVGRPPGSPNKLKPSTTKQDKSPTPVLAQRTARGRPKGSKNKVKPAVTTDSNG